MTVAGETSEPPTPPGEPDPVEAATLMWGTASQAIRVVLHRPHLVRTTLTALVVGT